MVEQILMLTALAAASFHLGVQHARKKANEDAISRQSKIFADIIMDMESYMTVGCATEFRRIKSAYLKRHGLEDYD